VLAGATLLGRRNRLAPLRGPPLHGTPRMLLHAVHATLCFGTKMLETFLPGAADEKGVIRGWSADAVGVGQSREAVGAASGMWHVDVRFLIMTA
jgi:hypothetical protein